MPSCADTSLVCADGTRLAARIWSPDGAGPWPVLLMRQPYGRAIASTVTYAHPSWYAQRGFLVVIQDVRGRGDSQGSFAGFRGEATDGAEAVGWARQLRGSNGRVGTYGFSYQGMTQLLTGADPPDCLAPAMAGLDERLHWASEGGAHWWWLGVAWALQLAAEGCRRRGDGLGWLEIRRSLEGAGFLRDGLALLQRHDPGGMGLDWLRRDPAVARGWIVHPVSETLLRRPMLLIGGWHDPHLRGILDLWERSRRAGGHPQLHIGAWSHLDWHGGVDELQLAFFRRHLLEPPPQQDDTSAPQAIALQCSTTARWQHGLLDGPVPAWHLVSSGLAAVRSDEGRLMQAPGQDAGRGDVCPVVIVHDPWRPVPGRGGHLGPEPGVVDRADLDRRTDVACFTTAPLLKDLKLLGRPQLSLRVAADQPSFDLCAILSVVAADGRQVRQISMGLSRFRGPVSLEPRRYRVQLQPLLATLRPGERLRLSLAGSAWPQVAVNPGDGTLPEGGTGPDHRIITLTIDPLGSRLWIPPLAGAN